MPFIPTPELVAIHWLKGVSGIRTDLVNSTVPARSPNFAKYGFVQVQSGGGDRDLDTFMRNSQAQVDTWAYNPNSQQVPWAKANQLAELILAGTENPARRVVLPTQYDDALVRQVYPIGEPRRLPGEGDFARYSMNLIVVWTPVRK